MDAGERLSDQVLHRDEVLSIDFPEIEHAAHVRVCDLGSDARLVQEHLDVTLLAREVRVDPFERHELLEAR